MLQFHVNEALLKHKNSVFNGVSPTVESTSSLFNPQLVLFINIYTHRRYSRIIRLIMQYTVTMMKIKRNYCACIVDTFL